MQNTCHFCNRPISKDTVTSGEAVVTATKRALLIGINYTRTENQLQGCVADCEHIDCLLTSKLGYDVNNIVFLNDSKNSNKLPTRENILRELKSKIRETQKGDMFFLGYSGHGSRCKDPKRTDKHGYEESIVPLDLNEIMDQELRQLFCELHQDCNVFVMTDSCFSGNVIDLRYNLDVKRIKKNERNIIESTLQTDECYPETQCTIVQLSGCKTTQTSADAYEDKEHQGAMTWAFLKVMKQHDNKLTLSTLLCEMRELLKSHKYSQVPQLNFGRKTDADTVLIL